MLESARNEETPIAGITGQDGSYLAELLQSEKVWRFETDTPYGLAKKMLLVQAQAYRDQYDYNAIYLLPVNRFNLEPARRTTESCGQVSADCKARWVSI